MDVFSLMATISLNSKGFESALQGAQNGLSSLVKNVAATQLAVKGLEAAFGTITKLAKSGIDAYANYEQLVGGVDTLFKSSSDKVQEYAKNAYKTAGLSANQYMEQATSFSATLIQGLTKSAEAAQKKATGSSALQADAVKQIYSDAADLSDVAIRDMSDNANKMGTDMTALQNAYNGFAKQNFTMLDNLKLGYGGTKTEMVRLINDSGVLDHKISKIEEADFATMISAIHKIQQEMGITGTTAEEAASTIQGSEKSLYAAFQNLLTLTTDGTDQKAIQEAQDAFVSSFSSYFNDNLAPKIIAGLNGTTTVVDAVCKAILTVDEETLSGIVDAALNAGTGLITGVTSLIPGIFEKIAAVFKNPKITEEDATSFGTSIGNFIGTFITEGSKHLPNILTGMITLGFNAAGGFITGLIDGLTGRGAGSIYGELDKIDKRMDDSMEKADETYIKESSLINYLDKLKEQYGELASQTPEWKTTMEELITLDGAYKDFFDSESLNLVTNTEAMKNYTKAKHDMAVETAKMNALQEKEQLVLSLQAQVASLQGENDAAQRMKESAGTLTGKYILDALGYTEKDRPSLYAGMDAETFADTLAELSAKTNELYGTSLNLDPEMYLQNGKVTLESLQQVASALETATGGSLDTRVQNLMETIDKQDSVIEENRKKLEDLEYELGVAQASYDAATQALDIWAAHLGVVTPDTSGNGGLTGMSGDVEYPGHATGLDYVPYDGYIAELHKGEAVLTSAEASGWRSGSGSSDVDYSQIASVVADAIKSGMGSVGFYFDKEQVAAAVTDNVSQNIADKVRAWGYA